MRLKEKKKILIPVITLLAVMVVILMLMSKLSNDYLSSSLSETKNGAVEVKKPVINDDEISYSFKLPNDNSSITYKIKIKNQSDYDNLLKSLKLLDKKSIGYKVKGFDDKKIKPGETKIITITFYPKDGGSDDTIDLDIKIDTSSSNNNKNNGSDKNNNKNNNNKNNNNKNNNNKNNNKNNNTTDDTKNNETKNDTTQNNNVNNNTNNNSSNNSSNNNKNNNNNNNNNQNNNSTTNPNKPGSDTKNDNDKNQDVKKYYVIYKTDSVITGEYVTEGGKVNPPIVQTITFKYWSLKEDGEEFDLNTPVTSNMTLYAVYDKNVYTVTFMDGNDVYKTFENQNYGDIISLNNPEKIGYTFKYWSLKENGDKYSPLKVTGNMTLYAVYEIKKCNVTYIVDGIKTKTETYDYGTVLNPEEPIKEGYTFKYWSLTDGGEEYSLITLTDDITLYAVFKINTYTVSFIDDDKNVKDLTIEYNNKINQNDVPTVSKEGYVFTGWSLNKTDLFDFNTPVKENIKLYSTYKKIKNGVSFNDDNRITVKDVDYGDAVEKLDPQGKTGYTFKYWSLDKQTEFDFTTSIKSAVTLYAVYEANKYIISYDNDGEILSETKEVTYDQKYGTLKEVSKEGYTFDGWYTEKTGGVKITEDSVVDILSNTTLYARYNINTYKVTYDYKTNGGKSVSTPVSEVDYNSQIDLSVTAEKDNYEFVGWNTDKDAKEGLTNLQMQTSDVTLYAIYRSDVNIEFYANNNTLTLNEVVVSGEDKVISSCTLYNNDESCTISVPTISSEVTPNVIGFTVSKSDKEKIINSNDTINVTKTGYEGKTKFYAQTSSSKKTYTVTYEKDETIESTSKESDSCVINETYNGEVQESSCTVSLPTIEEKYGYKNGKWYDLENSYNEEDEYEISEDKTIYAKGEKREYTVTYKDGETVYDTRKVLYKDTLENTVSNPTKEQYTFKYWSLEENGEEYDFNTPVTKDITLYAVYQIKSYSVIYVIDGVSSQEETYEYGTVLTPEEPTKEGYTFKYWSLTDGGEEYSPITVISDMTLYAVFKINTYTVSFIDNDKNVKDLTIEYNNKINQNDLPTVSKEGYTFTGWSLNKTDLFDFNTPVKENIKLYSKYKKIQYGVTFNDDNRITVKDVDYGDVVEKLDSKGKTGYTFKYWSLDKKTEFDFTTSIKSAVTLYAVYEIKKCNVVYIVDGVQIKTEKYEYGTVLTPEEPTKEGYTFKYWSLTDGGEEYSPITVTNDMTLYAVFKINTYTVTFMQDANRLSSVVVDYNSIILSENIPETQKNGYTFKYWSLDKQTKFDLNTPIKQDTTLYTVYEANKYIISYDNDGEILSETKEVTYDQKYGTLKEVSKEGYTFDGWYTSKTDGVKITEDSVVNILSNTTLYARYNINTYTLTVNTNNGVDNKVYNLKYKETKQIDNPEKTGYTFVNWSVVGVSSSISGNIFTMGSEDAVIIANYNSNVYTITLDNKGADESGTTSVYEKYNDGIYSSIDCQNKITNITVPSKIGYTFKGYYESETSTSPIINSSGVIQMSTTKYLANTTLIAKWEVNTYTLTVNTNNGEASKTYNLSYKETKTIPNPEKEGYTFTGWTLNGQGSTFNQSVFTMGYEDATLSAEYTVNTYQVKYDGNGATGTMPNSTYTYGVSYNLTSNTYQKTGYTFVGWNTDKTKTEALYLDGASVKNLTSVNNNVVTLYAIWKVNTYSLSINPNTGVWNTKTDIQKFNLNYGETKEIANPTKEGYTFKSWTLEGAGSLLNQTTFTMGYENASLVANYEPNVYTITLNSSSATTQGTSMIYQKYNTGIYLDSALTTSMTTSSNNINIPSKTGYIFGGYYTEENGSGTMIINENGYITSSITNTTYKNNVTLYAKWTRLTASMISYTDTYNMGCSNVQCAIDKIKNILDN